jgi:ABC-2 type transport system permease protein
MIGLVVRKELRAIWRDGRLLLLGLSLFLMFAGLLAASSAATRAAEAERNQVGATARDQWERQGVKHPHRAAHFGIYAFKPMLPLAAVDPGVGAQVGQSLWLEPHKRNMARNSPTADAPVAVRLGQLVPAFVLVALVPLLLIGLGHNAVTHEREAGTLRMLHGAGMSGATLLLGKWMAMMLALGMVLLPALAAGAWLLIDSGGRALDADDAARAGLLVLALLIYYATFAALAIAVSARLQTSRGALFALVAVWIACVLVVPRLGAALAERACPLPTGEAFWTAIAADIQRGLPGDGDAASRLKAFDAELLKRSGVTRLEDLPYGANAERRLFRDAYATRVHALHFGRLWKGYATQQNVLRVAALLSPALPMRGVSMALAGTDLAHQRHFEEAAEAYREYFTVQIDEWDKHATQGVVSYESKYAGNAQWQAIAPFAYGTPTVGFALQKGAPDAALLLAWLGGATALLLWAGRRLVP